MTKKYHTAGLLIILAFVLLHLPFITSKPVDHHSWRQVTTAGVARAFAEESPNIFYPRVFERGETSGITGMEFPLYNYLIFIFIKLFGQADWYGRLVSLVFGTLGLYWFWRFASLAMGERAGLFGLLALAVSPLYFYFSRNIQPDIPMVALLAGSFYFIMRWKSDGKSQSFWLSCALFTLAGLIKLPAVVFFPFLIAVVLEQQGRTAAARPANYAFAILPALFIGLWYLYSAHLVEAFGLRYFYLGGDLRESLSYLLIWKFYKVALVSRLPEIVSNFALFPLALAGLYSLRKLAASISIYILVLLLIPYYILGGYHLYVHDYYSLPAAPILALLAGCGAFYLLRSDNRAIKIIVIVLLSISPVVGIARAAVWYQPVYPEFIRAKNLASEIVLPRSGMVAAWRVDPTLLYFTGKSGWALPPEDVNLQALYNKGARFLITTDDCDSRIREKSRLELMARDSSLRLYRILGLGAVYKKIEGSLND